MTVEEKLRALFELQKIDSQLDEIRILKGELPIEVRDLEDEIAVTQTRIKKIEAEIKDLDLEVARQKVNVKDAENTIARYNEQLNDVKNNREFEAINREIENQRLEIQLAQRKMTDIQRAIKGRQETLEQNKGMVDKKSGDLEVKREELKEIIQKTEKQEAELQKKSDRAAKLVEDRLLVGYNKIRGAYRNGLAVAKIERNACGGCFNQIPPQRQLEIRQRKKVIVCEHCGRVVVDDDIANPSLVANA